MNVKLALKTPKKLVRNQNGQLTVFLAIGLTIFLTMTAFIINVGLFVKAKINLQNATDAAAWSGAAVQARQLSQIAYLNYEIRNVYKEWMFKYYILGNYGHTKRINNADYRLGALGATFGSNNFDRYNIPSICVHAGNSPQDICLSSFIPGLPRFETIDLPNITSESQEFIDRIATKKGQDCSFRSAINYATALIWTYGTGATLASTNDLPALTSGRAGAWPSAFILGARIRTLEAMVNRPPITDPLCLGGAGCINVASLDTTFVANERPIKAFWAGLRNYSGGSYKEDTGSQMDETLSTFQIEELAPTPFEATEDSLSGMLIPRGSGPSWNPRLLTKNYLDLQAIPVNYAIFYTSFSSRSQDIVIDGDSLPSDAECTTTKTAMPVPAYLTGFQKNPKLLTYYAVRSRVKFSGLFFPAGLEPIDLTAVAAAKPFGGRIGPKLFQVDGSNKSIKGRDSNTETRTAPNLSTLVASGADLLAPGTPIPGDSAGSNFWLGSITEVIGGVPGAEVPRYSIPNMIYNFNNIGSAETDVQPASGGTDPFQKLEIYSSAAQAKKEGYGIFNPIQFQLLQANIVDEGTPEILSSDDLRKTIQSVRQPTYYDAINYLIPTAANDPDKRFKATAEQVPSTTSGEPPSIKIYAPLIDTISNNALFDSPAALKVLAQEYITNNNESVVSFLTALQEVATQIKNSGIGNLYDDAANVIYPLSRGVAPTDPGGFRSEMAASSICTGAGTGAANVSIAARFSTFLQQDTEVCPNAKPLSVLLGQYIEGLITGVNQANLYHFDTWYDDQTPKHAGNDMKNIMTAYRPGEDHGADRDGVLQNPLASKPINLRNFYSTKFIQFDIVSNNSSRSKLVGSNGVTLIEGYENGFDISNDVETQISGDYINKLQDTIDVRW